MYAKKTAIATFAALAAALAGPGSAMAADAMYGLTDDNRIIRFNSDSPNRAIETVAVQGLQPGETLVGIDVRPATDQLYGVSTANRIYQVNMITGQTRATFPAFTPPLAGTSYGVDFNPVPDALRIVSETEQNLRVPFQGGNAGNAVTDTPLQYRTGDANAGQNPTAAGAAYTNSFPGATETALFDIDTARDVLVRQDPPNAGTLNTIGPLGFDAEDLAGFDISPQGNVGFAALTRRGESGPSLYRIDLNNGSATPVNAQARIATDRPMRGLAVLAGAVDDDRSAPALSVAFSSAILEQNTDTLLPTVSCDEACTITVTATVEGRAAGIGNAALNKAGSARVPVVLNQAARSRIDRPGSELIRLSVRVVDAAGNVRESNNRLSRTQTAQSRLGGG
jgi:hypothetical protein